MKTKTDQQGTQKQACPFTCPLRANKDQNIIPIDDNMQTFVMAKEQNRFSEGWENPRGCGKSKRQNPTLIRHIMPNKM